MITVRESFYPFVALTDPGLVRKTNEDRYAITAFRSEGFPAMPGILAVICDGVGGESAGEVAAELAVNGITEHALLSASDDPALVLPEAVKDANEAIHRQVRDDPAKAGMAATAACAWISGRRLSIATLGDSRIYLVRENSITQLSIDHTWVQEALETGAITEEESENHPNAHVIRRFLGSEYDPDLDMRITLPDGQIDTKLDLKPWDIVFMCTDGCSDMVTPDEILARLNAQGLDDGLAAIKKLAFERGGRDNITMIAIEIPNKVPGKARNRHILRWVLVGMAIAFAIGLGLYFGWLYQNFDGDVRKSAFTPQHSSGAFDPILTTAIPRLTPQVVFTPTVPTDALDCG